MKKKIAISAVNFFEGGPLSVLLDCLDYLNSDRFNNYKVIALIHKKEILDTSKYPDIEFIEFPKSRTSYFYRLYYEYVYFKKIAKDNNVHFWLSLHDMTPNVGNIPQAVYCHNVSAFNSVSFSDLIMPTQFLFNLLYKYVYKINIKKNKYIIVQQLWIKEKFITNFNILQQKIVIAKPQVRIVPSDYISGMQVNKQKKFFFPSFPRTFKNFEIIGDAVILLNDMGIYNFEVVLTIDGTENKYSKQIVNKYRSNKNINFIGLISREEVFQFYDKTDCLLFPSNLESWGLPISEFKQFAKPMIVANLPYAKETVSNYDKVNFFNPTNAYELSELMKKEIEGCAIYDDTTLISYPDPIVNSWAELFTVLLN